MIDFWPYISPNRAKKLDPINLVFFGNAPAAQVAHHLRHSLPEAWDRAVLSHAMFAYIDDTPHGGQNRWKRQDEDLMLGDTFGSRYHIRVYECHVPDFHGGAEPEHGVWSIAGVHREHYEFPARHAVDAWDEPREFVRAALADQPFVGQVYTAHMGSAGRWHGPAFDGKVAFIELR